LLNILTNKEAKRREKAGKYTSAINYFANWIADSSKEEAEMETIEIKRG